MKSYGHIAYEACRASTGGKSIASGHPIPEWPLLPEAIRTAWECAGNAVAIEALCR